MTASLSSDVGVITKQQTSVRKQSHVPMPALSFKIDGFGVHADPNAKLHVQAFGLSPIK